MFKPLFMFSVVFFITACSSLPSQIVSHNFDKTLFDDYPSNLIESEDEVFAISDDARAFVDLHTKDSRSQHEKINRLVDAIFDHASLNLAYLAEATTTANETFTNAEANCLSLTIMTYAMVNYLGMETEFQNVEIPEFWTHRGGYTLITGHINLRVKARRSGLMSSAFTRDIIIDFDPQSELKGVVANPMTKIELLSEFYNNKGSEYMLHGNASAAYAYYRKSLKVNPSNESAWLNLGVLYRQHDYSENAEQAYVNALRVNPNFNSAYENLAILYRHTGRNDEASRIDANLHLKRLDNPYYHAKLGETALLHGKTERAISHFKQAIRINKEFHQFYFGLAKAYALSGKIEDSKNALEKAWLLSQNSSDRNAYNEKLIMLNQLDEVSIFPN